MFLKLRNFLIFAFYSLIAFFGLGTGAYLAILEEGNKFLAERFFLFSLLAAGIMIYLLYRVHASSRRVLREMERMIDMARYSGVLAEERFERFGPTGRNLKYLYHELHELNVRKTERIYLFSALAEGLLDFIETPILVIDAAGKILFADAAFIGKMGEDASPAAGRPVAEILPELDFKAVIHEAERTHSPLEIETGMGRTTFYPLHDRSNFPALFIAAFGKPPAFLQPDRWKRKDVPGLKDSGRETARGFLRLFQRGNRIR